MYENFIPCLVLLLIIHFICASNSMGIPTKVADSFIENFHIITYYGKNSKKEVSVQFHYGVSYKK